MKNYIRVFQFSAAALLGLMVLGLFFLYWMSLESVANWPEFAWLQYPLLCGFALLMGPGFIAGVLTIRWVKLFESGQPYAIGGRALLAKIHRALGVLAAMLILGLAAFWFATQLMHPTLLYLWLVVFFSVCAMWSLVRTVSAAE